MVPNPIKTSIKNKTNIKIGSLSLKIKGCHLSVQKPRYKIDRTNTKRTELRKHCQKFKQTISFHIKTKTDEYATAEEASCA